MRAEHILRARKSIVKKTFALLALLLSLSMTSSAYSTNMSLKVRNRIPPSMPYYSKKGYTVKPSGHGKCMYGVYNPASCTADYHHHKGRCRIGLHYASVRGCSFRYSAQRFDVVNNDTGKVVGKFTWRKPPWDFPDIKMIKNPGSFMKAGIWGNKRNVLNISPA
ncbi:hypothetical protein [Candidatus Sororendozoicomonas aggregata]|uniref:hypothetical protein n=1 Tax=Candidatus Sororendozoicomonas aggregata TaxID=3073239 RepID=UPI002ED07ECE